MIYFENFKFEKLEIWKLFKKVDLIEKKEGKMLRVS